MATSISASPLLSSKWAMWEWMGSREALRCLTKSNRPPRYSKIVSSGSEPRSSLKRICRPFDRNAISRSRVVTVSASYSVVSEKISESAQKVTWVPVRLAGLPWATGPRGRPYEKSWRQWYPSRTTSTSSRVERALTTETPTPWRPSGHL